jgi:hypothetical protein
MPVVPGIRMSVMRHANVARRFDFRNPRADENTTDV